MLFQYLGLLDNFKSDIDELDLSYGNKTLKILRIPKNELENFLLLQGPISSSYNDRLQMVIDCGEKRYWIAYSYEVKSEEAMTKAWNVADEEIDQIISALRLFKEGFVRIVFRMYKGLGSGKNFIGLKTFRSDERTYSLLNSELSSFKEFLRTFANCEQKILPHVDIALRRFADGYERLKLEDRIIDYMIGLEALYLQGEGMGEFSYKLAHRVSVLLKRERSERQRLFDDMKKSYTLRSKIVHGLKYHLCFEDIWFVEDVLRQSIKSFLDTPNPKWSELIF